jgi:crotonobetainyl-CoA:carnitine CoA-transferase CaiB-like acyl-CoA transferase
MNRHLPLEGITVLEIGHTVAAPYAGMILAELGANVIKLESPDGDYTRGMPPFRADGTSAVYQALNRGKRSIIVDMKDEQEAAALKTLIVREVDVLIHNLKFGAMDKLGFASESLMQAKPSLVYSTWARLGTVVPCVRDLATTRSCKPIRGS